MKDLHKGRAGDTGGPEHPRRGPLGVRLLLAFVAVALSSVLVLTIAALIGTDQGLAATQRTTRDQTIARTAQAAATAYTTAGGWAGANLTAAAATGAATGAQLKQSQSRGG